MTAPLFLALAAAAAVQSGAGGPRGEWQLLVTEVAVVIGGAQAQPPPAAAPRDPHRGDWQQAYDGRHEGKLLPLRELERRVVPQMAGAQYLGVEMDSLPVYTFKFLRDGHVIWVDVDGRSGQIIRRTGR